MSKKVKINSKKLAEQADILIKELSSDFDAFRTEQEWEMGIDEAGRGPVLGPLVYGCCIWPIRFKEQLSALGFDDSKKLTEDERDILFEIIEKLQNKLLYYKTNSSSAELISNRMLSCSKEQKNLNELSFNSAYYLIDSIMEQVIKVYVDTVGSASRYQTKLESDFGEKYKGLQFQVEEKADSKFAIVSAASICAKVTRDKEIQNFTVDGPLNDTIDREWGSGYPSDPNTKKWLQNNFDPIFAYPNIVRYSWSTISNILRDKKLDVEFHECEVIDTNQMKLDQMNFKTLKKDENKVIRKPTYLEKQLFMNNEKFQI